MREEFRAIKPDEMEECLDLWGNVFERVGRDYFIPYFRGDPWFKPEYTRVCAVDGRLASAVQICERRVRVGDAEIVMGGIGNVGAYPEFRGRGYSSHLLRDCVEVMRENGMDFSALFTGIQPFYEKIGWRSVPQKLLVGQLRADLPDRTQTAYSIRQCDLASDLASISEIYEAFNSDRPLTTVRTPEYWSGYGLARFGKPQFTLMAETKGKPVGYLLFGYDAPNCWLKEIGYLPGNEGCVEALIHQAAVQARGAGAETAWVNLPLESEVVASVEQIAEGVERREPMGMMCRVVNMRSLGERILPELNRRAKAAGCPSGSLSLETELGSLDLSVESGGVRLGAENPVRISLGQSNFFCLLFGIKGIEDMDLSVADQAGRIISALFPPQRPVFWLVDHI